MNEPHSTNYPRFPWRFLLSTAIGGALALLAAANWPDPNSTTDGIIVGFSGTFAGIVAGMIWEFRADPFWRA